MNINYKQMAIGLIIGVIVAVGAGYFISQSSLSHSFGAVVGVGQVQTQTFWFYNGFYAGTTQQFSVSSVGALTAAGVTDNGALTVTGNAQILQTTSSTLKIGTGVGNITGCLELGDSSSASTTVYITASGATVSATTTKPAACR